jgi:hypothetical protein
MGTARASTINRLLTRRCSRGSRGSTALRGSAHGCDRLGVSLRWSLPSISGSIHRGRLRELLLIPKADGRLRKRDKQAV